jgi:uncharacterized membrane protein YdjX (TVP38/TMEM64 family)
MDKNLLLTALYKRRIEIKYGIIALLVVGGLFLLAENHVFDGVGTDVNRIMDDLSGYGAIGMFLIALPSNTTLVILVPYNLPMFTLALYAHNVWDVIWLGAATGLGAGIGEVISYAVAHALIAKVDDLEDSGLFRWTNRQIKRRPALIPYLVFLASATPVPDLMLIVPVALVGYPWRKMVLPMVTGKVVQNVIVALIFRFAEHRVSSLASHDINIDFAAILVALFVIIIAYQIEKARLIKRSGVN